MHKSSKSKFLVVFGCIAMLVMVLFMPVIIAAGAVATPVVAIYELFSGSGDSMSEQVITLINEYLKMDETKKVLKEVYQPLIDAAKEEDKDHDIPLHWLLIPNLLAGLEEVKTTTVERQIEAIKEANYDLNKYIDIIRVEEPWKSRFGYIATTTIVRYIENYTSYLGQEGNIDVGDLKEEEFLYPLKEKAIVTSEFGGRDAIDTNAGVTGTMHTGIDLAYGRGKTCGVPIYASMPGTVVATEQTQDQAGANWGAIQFKNLQIWYLHLRDPFPYEVGDEIKKGQFVGYIGDTGLATGCHLHFETHVDGKAVNPRKFLDF